MAHVPITLTGKKPPTGACQWLRFYDRQENLVLLPSEIAEQERQRAEAAESRSERLAARLRDLGENLDFI